MAHELYNKIIMSNRYYNLYHSKHIVFSKTGVQNFYD